jgi:hypothetical protein
MLASYSVATVGIRNLGKITKDPCRTANAQAILILHTSP